MTEIRCAPSFAQPLADAATPISAVPSDRNPIISAPILKASPGGWIGVVVGVGVAARPAIGSGVSVGVGAGLGVSVGLGVGVEAGSGAGVGAGVEVGSGAGVGVNVGVGVGSGVGVGAGAAASEAGEIVAVGDAMALHPARRSSHAVRLSVRQNRKAPSRYGLAARREYSTTRRAPSGPLAPARLISSPARPAYPRRKRTMPPNGRARPQPGVGHALA